MDGVRDRERERERDCMCEQNTMILQKRQSIKSIF